MIPSGLVRLALDDVSLPPSTRDCIRRSSLRGDTRGIAAWGFTYLSLLQKVLRGRQGRLSQSSAMCPITVLVGLLYSDFAGLTTQY